jgi:hypothetical protein
MAVKLLGDLSASGNATFNSEVNLPSGGQIDWANGDARIIEGAVTNYSLSLQTYTGSALTTKMFIASGGNVGIGTTSPSSRLHVIGQDVTFYSGTGSQSLQLGRNANERTELFVDDTQNKITAVQDSDGNGTHNFILNRAFAGSGSNNFIIQKAGTAQLLVDTLGNVGIGTTAPLEKLHVAGKINSSNNIVSNSTYTMFTGRSSRTVDDYGGLNKEYFKANLVTAGPNTTGESSAHGIADLRFQLANSAGNTGMSDIMTLRSGGNVGIGTTTPAHKLDVAGDIIINDTSDPTLYMRRNDGTPVSAIMLDTSTDNIIIGATNMDELIFRDDSGEGMRLDGSGNLGIGTTSPAQKLHVVGTSNFQGAVQVAGGTFVDSARRNIYIDSFSAGGGAGIFFRDGFAYNASITAEDHNGSSADGICISGYDGVSFSTGANTRQERMRIHTNGNVGIGTTSPAEKLEVNGNIKGSILYATDDIVVADKIIHYGDTDTYFQFDANRIRLIAGSATKFDSNNTYVVDTTPASPSITSTSVVGETIEVVFNASATADIDYYQVWSSVAGGSFDLIAQIPESDFASSMTVIDASFSISGTMSYRVYAVKNGRYSSPATDSQAISAPTLDVGSLSVVNLNTAYYIQYNMPESRFVDHVEIYMDSEAVQGNLTRTGATLVYSGNNTSFMHSVGVTDNYHQFWVEVVES